ncbi:MAG TPA: hypothetical protein VLX68_09535 [Chitinivibrionales bacterium]|nr:hypothetical protein [Chitinivibrionales bacterium]
MKKSTWFPIIIVAVLLCTSGCSDSWRILRTANGAKPSVSLKIGIMQSSQAPVADSLLKRLSNNIQSEANCNKRFTTTPDTGKADLLFEITIANYSLATAESQTKFFNVRDSINRQNARINDSIENEFGDPTPKLIAANVIANAISLPLGFVTIVYDVGPEYQRLSSKDSSTLQSTQASARITLYVKLKSQKKSILWEDVFKVRFDLYKPFTDELQQQNLLMNVVYTLMQHVPIYKGASSKK